MLNRTPMVRQLLITADENSRDVMLGSEHASSVLSHLEKYEYAGPQHVSLTLMWHTMTRVGGVYAVDVDDYNPDGQYVKVRHRPDPGHRSRTKATVSDSSRSRTTSANYSSTGWKTSGPT